MDDDSERRGQWLLHHIRLSVGYLPFPQTAGFLGLRLWGETPRSLSSAAVKVAGFPPHENLARLQRTRTTFMDLTYSAYLKRTYFGLVTTKVQKYRCFV
jgi:hypothetical protein